MTRALSTTGVLDHCGSAAAADSTTCDVSSLEHSGVRAITWPVDGLYTFVNRSAVLARHWPATSIGTSVIVCVCAVGMNLSSGGHDR